MFALSPVLVSSIPLSSINIPYATFLPGIAGSYDAITQASGNKKVYIFGGNQAAWSGIITGTAATISGSSDFGEDSTTFYASVDGAAAVGLTKIGTNLFQVFSGLAQGPHSVVIVAGGAYGNVVYVLSTSTAVLAVTGAPPSVYVPTWVNPFDGSALDAWSAFPINAPSVNWTPYASPGNTATASSAVPSLRVRTAATFLLITTRARYIFVGIGSSITRYDTGAAEGYARQYKVSGLSGSATTYNVWISAQPLGGGNQLLTVASDAAMVDIGSKRRLDQFGDSITFGSGCTGTGDVDTMRTASALSMTGSTYGISGTTVSALAANLPGFLSGRVIDSTNDVAVIAIGRNDASISGASMTAQQVTDYTSCCNQLKAKYGKVICRGMLPESTYNWSGWASSINSIITSIGNANIKAAVTTGWTGFATAEGTHPTDAGYITLAGYATTTYTPLI